jgi:pyroglutamyl-peptidase
MTKRRSPGRPLRVLVTGFGPYPGVPSNPTGTLARRIARDGRLRFAGIEAKAAIFETTYSGIGKALGRALEQADPDVCLHLGLAPRARTVRVELRAENRARPLSPDASGRRPDRREIVKGAKPLMHTSVRTAPVLTALRLAGVPAAPSRDAGAYLCNAVYFLSLDAARHESQRLVLFVHNPRPAPHPGHRPAARRRGPPRPAPARLGLALAQVALLLAAMHRDRVRPADQPGG